MRAELAEAKAGQASEGREGLKSSFPCHLLGGRPAGPSSLHFFLPCSFFPLHPSPLPPQTLLHLFRVKHFQQKFGGDGKLGRQDSCCHKIEAVRAGEMAQ